jgi:alpha-mannosidase
MSHFNSGLVFNRVRHFIKLVSHRILGEHHTLDATYRHSEDPVYFDDRLKIEAKPITEGEGWGKTWDSAWFHLKGSVPQGWNGKKVVASLNFGGEACLFDSEGTPIVGLTNGSTFDVNYAKDIHYLFEKCEGGEDVEFWAEAAANGLFGVNKIMDPEYMDNPSKQLHGTYQGSFNTGRLYTFCDEHWHLFLDLQVLFDLYKCLPEESRRKKLLIRQLNSACTAYDHAGASDAREALKPALEMKSDPATINLTGVGHAHIDTGWLWPVRETIRKSARTFSSALELMDKYPDYTFGASQPAHYAMVKEHYPKLYEKIKASVAAGRWELQGGMWVESDCNIISGESMIRQFLIGKNFFKDEFDVDVKNLWLPDVFGYSAQLPQILQKSGCPTFLTQKLSWGKYTDFPHHTFVWRGIDGSEVVAHFPPENTYNAGVMPNGLAFGAKNYKDQDVCDEGLSLFGIGDGGGGPKDAHIERARRVADLNGLPRFKMGPAQPVLDRLEANKEVLDTWTGELYLEVHRGVLTTQAETKRLNRRIEEVLKATEEICVRNAFDAYPTKELDEIWKMMLLNQFHDIIPGSSIQWVYDVTEKELNDGLEACQKLIRQALGVKGERNCLTLINPSCYTFDDLITLPEGWDGAKSEGVSLPGLKSAQGTRVRVQLPAHGSLILETDTGLTEGEQDNQLVLENSLVSYTFDQNLQLIKAFDKVLERDLLASKCSGNAISLYEDRPHNWDAWEVDEWYLDSLLEQAKVKGTVTRAQNDSFGTLEADLQIGNSKFRQRITLKEGSARLDFETWIDWQEKHKMLRVGFPTVYDVDHASFEIQYGTVQRLTRRNSLADVAKFEVCGHRYADLSRNDSGLALLSDSKYGYRVVDGLLDLNLLRSPTYPDPEADLGEHHFTYALFPHEGNLSSSSSVRAQATMLNQGLTIVEGKAELPELPFSLEGEGLEMGAIKKAEKEDAIIIRIVETRGLPTRGKVHAKGMTLVPTNLLEWDDELSSKQTDEIELDLSPFEIFTLKILPEA